MKTTKVPGVRTMLAATLLWAALAVAPDLSARDLAVQASDPVTPGVFAGDLRDLPRTPAPGPDAPDLEIPRVTHPRPGQAEFTSASGRRDPLLGVRSQSTRGTQTGFGVPILNFPGQSYTGVDPPDTVGEVGPSHYIQMVNASGGSDFAIYDKSGGLIAGPTALDSLGTGACADGHGDPIVLYDRLADRWLLSEFSDVGNHLCVYISQSPDPVTGGWFSYDFAVPDFPDYPKYGVWPTAYFVGTNEASPAAYALDRTRMLSGQPATFLRVTVPALGGFLFQMIIPADLDGPIAPPAASPGYFLRHRDDEAHGPGSNDPSQDFLDLFEFSPDFAVPGNSTLSAASIAVSEFDSDLCGLFAFSCFAQPGGGSTPDLDPLREVVMWRLQYRNDVGGHETLVGNFVTDVSGADQGGIRWFELRKTGAGPWTLFQEGTHAPDATHRWLGGIAMDKNGNIALGYSVSSSSVSPGMRYAGRTAAAAAGTLPEGEFSIVSGAGANLSSRWGDYSAMNVDPVDDCTFWYTNEIASGGVWDTQIAAFRFDDCVPAGGPLCQVTTDQASYLTGEQIEISTLRFANPAEDPLHPVRVRLQLGFPSAPFTADPLDVGADGTVGLQAGADVMLGPLPFLTVPDFFPRGAWQLRCALETPDGVTVLAEDLAEFAIE